MSPLRNAYEYMEKMGMCKGSPYGDNGEVCAIGACIIVDVMWTRFDILDRVAAEQFPDRLNYGGARPVASVNDHPDTTLDDMRIIFEKAAIADEELNV